MGDAAIALAAEEPARGADEGSRRSSARRSDRTQSGARSCQPTFWHHHTELLWELSALHLHWSCSYYAEKSGSAPLAWHRDFADTRLSLRDWVAAVGTRLDRDRPSRQTSWPGEPPAPAVEDIVIENREAEFVEFVPAEVTKRREEEDRFYRSLNPTTGEVS